jgi:carbamoyltransferase
VSKQLEQSVILGLSFGYHDSAAAILHNGNLSAAIQEERLSRKKGDSGFPYLAIEEVLRVSQLTMESITEIVFYEKPYRKFERIMRNSSQRFPTRFKFFRNSFEEWLSGKLDFFEYELNRVPEVDFIAKFKQVVCRVGVKYSHHHLSHAASAAFLSGFRDSIVLVADAVGENESLTIWDHHDTELILKKSYNFPNSIGVFYSAITDFIGFKPNSGEYKVMGLAPYGEPIYYDRLKDIFLFDKIEFDWPRIHLNLAILDPCQTLTKNRERLSKHFGLKPRTAESKITKEYADVAASLQFLTNEVLLELTTTAKQILKKDNLTIAGGVGLNCVANEHIRLHSGFNSVWIQPAAGDAGAAVGAALALFASSGGEIEKVPLSYDVRLGSEFTDDEILRALKHWNISWQRLDDKSLVEKAASDLQQGKVIGWFQGRAEFGPRALGNRSILARPDDSEMQIRLNMKVKFRESFRPFAPIILQEDFENYFCGEADPFMIRVAKVRDFQIPQKSKEFDIKKSLASKRSRLQATTHLDGTARVQTINSSSEERIADLLKAFKSKTGLPVLINTSFNTRGEPIVYSPSDALITFAKSEIDVLYVGRYRVENQDLSSHILEYSRSIQFESD